jgi:hypothetical protein
MASNTADCQFMKNQLRAINLELNSNKESAPNKEEISLP